MPDITMCAGRNCPLKETCYRYKAKPNMQWQSYFEEPYDKKKQTCEYYLKINANKKD